MANKRITTAGSVSKTSGIAYQDLNGGSLIVDPGAYLETSNAFAAVLRGNFTATVNGRVSGDDAGGGGMSFLSAGAGNAASLTVGSSGQIYGGNVGVLATEKLTLKNSGTVMGNIAVLENVDATSSIANSGRIIGNTSAIDFVGTGTHTVSNAGIISGLSYAIRAGTGAAAGREVIYNSGQIYGDILLGDGNDVLIDYRGTAQGTIVSVIDAGAGNDVIRGGNNVEKVIDGLGSDQVLLGGGKDIYFAVPLSVEAAGTIDTVDGGAGFDTYDYSAGSSGLFLNLDSANHTDVYYGATIAARTSNSLQSGNDRVTGFEKVIGGSAADVVFGSSGADYFYGRDSGDDLWGFAGNDYLRGDAGSDFLIGGVGADNLAGGADGDRFIFSSRSDSTVSATGRDLITDFSIGQGDRIDLAGIDANTLVAGNDAFVLTSSGGFGAFSGAAGELRFYFSGTSTIVAADVNGDRTADFAITLSNHHTLSATEFFL